MSSSEAGLTQDSRDTPVDVTASVADLEALRLSQAISSHRVFLGLSIVALLLSAVLSVQGETDVVVPILGRPLPEICLARWQFGVNCPGCGLTRSFISLAHGDVAGAWSFNPAGVLWFAAFLWQIPYRGYQLRRLSQGKPALCVSRRLASTCYIALGAALIAQWVARLF